MKRYIMPNSQTYIKIYCYVLSKKKRCHKSLKHILFDYRETLSIHRKTISEPLKLLHQHLFLSKQTTLPHFITFNIYEVLTKIWREWMLNTQCTLLSTISNEDIKVRASSNFFPTFNKFYFHVSLLRINVYFSLFFSITCAYGGCNG